MEIPRRYRIELMRLYVGTFEGPLDNRRFAAIRAYQREDLDWVLQHPNSKLSSLSPALLKEPYTYKGFFYDPRKRRFRTPEGVEGVLSNRQGKFFLPLFSIPGLPIPYEYHSNLLGRSGKNPDYLKVMASKIRWKIYDPNREFITVIRSYGYSFDVPEIT